MTEVGAGAETGAASLVGEADGEADEDAAEAAGGAALKATRIRRRKSSLEVPAAMYSLSSPCFMMTTVGVLGSGKICDRYPASSDSAMSRRATACVSISFDSCGFATDEAY